MSYQVIENDGGKKFWNKFFEKHSKKNKVLGAKEGKNEKELKKILEKVINTHGATTDVKQDPRDVRKTESESSLTGHRRKSIKAFVRSVRRRCALEARWQCLQGQIGCWIGLPEN